MRWLKVFLLGCSAVIFLICGICEADVILGQSCAMSGPTSFLGTEMNLGAKAYFDKYAPEIKLKTLDDQYEPQLCIENTNKFVAEKVAALFGYVGTPTSKVAIPIAMENKTIFFGAFTGADFLSDHNANPYSFSFRADYDTEIEVMVKRLKEDLGVKRIALFVQQDAFGLIGVKGAVKAVKKIGGIEIVPPVPEIPDDSAPNSEWETFWKSVPNYKRNTVMIGRDARMISGNRVEAVIMVGTYRPCATAIRLWKSLSFDAVFMNISFVGANALASTCKEDVKNVYITQVVPDPENSSVPVVKEYQEAFGNDKPRGFVSLEGYIAAKIIHKAIKDAGADITSENIKKKIEEMSNYDVGGLNVSFGSSDHRGSDKVYITEIEAIPKGSGQFDHKFNYIDKLTKK